MGRKPSINLSLPPRLRVKKSSSGKNFYYYDLGGNPRKWKALGGNFVEALRLYAELECGNTAKQATINFRHVAERYTKEIIPAKAPQTQKDNLKELARLYEFFDNPPAPINEIRPIHIRMYLDKRSKAPVRANREVALFSHIFNQARSWGYTDQPNPCAGVKKHKEKGRNVYVDDEIYRAVWLVADIATKNAMDLAYLTGQRPADVLKLDERDIINDELCIRQNKTGAQLRIQIIGELAQLIARIKERKAFYKIRATRLIVDETGLPLSTFALRSRFDKARENAGIDKSLFQFRDLRAKAGTDKEEKEGMEAAKNQLGHANESMTRHYVRHRRGKKVTPTK